MSSNFNALFNGFNEINTKQFLEWVIKSGMFLFNNEYFEQINSVSMGCRVSDLFVNVIITTHLTNL